MSLTILADENIPAVEYYFPQGCSVRRMHGREISARQLQDVDVLLVRSITRVNQELLEGSRVSFVGTATSGVDHIDRDHLSSRGIAFAYAPGSNANSVVEYVLSAIATVGEHLEILLDGGTLGLVGHGFVGGALAARLHALGIACSVYDPWLNQATLVNAAALSQVLSCEVVSLHCELTQAQPFSSHHLLGAGELVQIPRDSLLINASRGAVIDNAALLSHLKRGQGPATVLDVWEGEPGISRELLQQVSLGTAHIAGYSLDGKILATRMLSEALSRHAGLPPPPAASPIPEAPFLNLPDANSSAGFVRAMLASRYDIRQDDQLLRETLTKAKPGGFDMLRKNYRERRELAGSVVFAAAPNVDLVGAMGCVQPAAGAGA